MALLTHNTKIQLIASSSKLTNYNQIKDATPLKKFGGITPFINDFVQTIGEDFLYANTNYNRALHFKESLLSNNTDIIWCIQGGSGAMQLIPYLEGRVKGFEKLDFSQVNFKLFIGYSDTTALHLFIHKNFPNFPTLHASMWREIIEEKYSAESFNRLEILLTGKPEVFYPLKLLTPFSPPSLNIEGILTGGNLTLIEQSIGTSWQIETVNKILFLEDVNMEAYQIERALEHLLQANIFSKVKSIILSEFTGLKVDEVKFIQERFIERLSEFCPPNHSPLQNLPVFSIKNIGHSFDNFPIFLNSPAKLHRSENQKFLLKNWFSRI